MLVEVYRGYDIRCDEKGFFYKRGGNKWYLPSVQDAKEDIDEWLDR